jgi:phosphopantothenoylcysteine decarboxylase/phosphopantothenate--cysteine ligase
MLKGKKILLGITGSIAAYKSAFLVRLLVKSGAEVRVIMTRSATDFISPLTLSTLSQHPVYLDLKIDETWANHVMLGRWADAMVIAPLSCNTLGKMANGICDNMLLATWLSATCPVMVAPAMDEDMWLHAATKRNLEKLKSFGNRVLPVETGFLASGLEGPGRMVEPENIVRYIEDFFKEGSDFAGKKVLVTAGPTYEPIDPVRFIGNHSSGKMGVAIAEEFAARGAEVTLVYGPGCVETENKAIKAIAVHTAEEMYHACTEVFPSADVAVMSAAVADYTPVVTAKEKIKKTDEQLTLELKKTKDILKALGERKRGRQILVGFALETENEKENARNKLLSKNADIIVLNSLKDPEAGFRKDTNKITLLERDGSETGFPAKSKQEVARDIVDRIKTLMAHV